MLIIESRSKPLHKWSRLMAMVVAGLLMIAFDLLNPVPRGARLLIAGGAMLAFLGLYLLWEDFIAPLFRRR